MTKRISETEIVKLDDIEHVLSATDMYIGQRIHSISPAVSRFLIQESGHERMEFVKDVRYPSGLLKLFDEAVTNASDNTMKSESPCTKIEITITDEWIEVKNNGGVFSVTPTTHSSRHDPSVTAYQPELAFFHCKSSSNYHKKQKVVAGKNGLGIKLASIMSVESKLSMCDGETYFEQCSKDHMKVLSTPKLRPMKKAPFLHFAFRPDLSLFYPPGQAPCKFEPILKRLFLTRSFDVAGTTPKGVKILFNGSALPVKTFKDYVSLFHAPDQEMSLGYFESNRWQVCLMRNPFPEPHAVSFVNGVQTYHGGTHVRYIMNQVYQHVKTMLPEIDIRRVQQSVMLFVNAIIEDPSFTSQSKDELVTAPEAFGSECVLDTRCLNMVKRAGIVEELKQALADKELTKIRQNIGASKHACLDDIVHLIDANYAGKAKHKCTLILLEGISAKQLGQDALSYLGSDYFGIMPMQGKGINAEKSRSKRKSPSKKNSKTLEDNVEFHNLCRVMGLQYGKVNERSDLRYDRIVIMTDQDPDGSHIAGLLLFLFHTFWPNLLKEPGFLNLFITPLVVVTMGAKRIPFFSIAEFRNWEESPQSQSKHTVKYYKGLGTSTSKEAKEYFGPKFQQFLKPFQPEDDVDKDRLTMAFSKKHTEQRKQWLQQYDDRKFYPYLKNPSIKIQDFVDQVLIHFSWMSVGRGLPLLQDGMTEAQRKCLHVFLQRNIVDDVKVADMQGEISKATNYHHGADSLSGTMVRMAQSFVGRQNIPLLVPSGQFGFRSDGGKVYASPRYIFTRLCPWTRLIFRKEDDPILPRQYDEGQEIEFRNYAPIIPMILVNGVYGNLGTGWSSSLPCFKPEDWIEVIRKQIAGQEWAEPEPWFRGFRGVLQSQGRGKFKSEGKVVQEGPQIWRITELPVRKWRDDYKQELVKMKEQDLISRVEEKHTQHTVNFRVHVPSGVKIENPITFFKLTNSQDAQLNLLVQQNDTLRVGTFQEIRDIFIVYYHYRLGMYEKRRQFIISTLKTELPLRQVKIQFIRHVLQGELKFGRKRELIRQDMLGLNIKEEFHSTLLDMSLSALTEERIQALLAEIDQTTQKIHWYEKVKPEQLWEQDLQELEREIQKVAFVDE